MTNPTFPLRIRWPSDALVGVVGEQWVRLPSGQIEAVYLDASELAACLRVTQWLREGRPPPDATPLMPRQAEMFPTERSHNYARQLHNFG